MNLTDLINAIERKAKWHESSEQEVKLGCSILMVVALLMACIALWLWK